MVIGEMIVCWNEMLFSVVEEEDGFFMFKGVWVVVMMYVVIFEIFEVFDLGVEQIVFVVVQVIVVYEYFD